MAFHKHTIVIISEYEDYEDDPRNLVRDAMNGDARLRSWTSNPIQEHELYPGEEAEFFSSARHGEP